MHVSSGCSTAGVSTVSPLVKSLVIELVDLQLCRDVPEVTYNVIHYKYYEVTTLNLHACC